MEPCVELLIGKKYGARSFFLNRHGIPIHQMNGNAVWNIEELPKPPFNKELNRLFQVGASGSCICLTTFFTLTSRAGRGDTQFR